MSDTIATLGLRVDASGATESIKRFGEAAGHATESVSIFEKELETAKQALEAFGLALGAIELLRAANEAREAAEQYEKLGAIAQQMATTFGISTDAIIESEQAMRDQGSTMEVARATTIKLLNAHIDLARATELTALAQNLAAKEGISESDAMQELILAIQTGMARTLKHAGVVADFTRATTDAASALGVETGQLSEQALEHIRLEAVLKAGAGLQGAYAATLQVTSGQVELARKALSDLRLSLGTVISVLTEGAFRAASKDLQELARYARENPAIFVKVADAIKVVAEAVAAATAAFVLYKTAAYAASAATGILASIETITAFVELAKGVETAADAFALLGLAAEAINPVAILASLAAIAAGLVAWHEASKSVKEDTEDFEKALSGLGDTIKTTGTKAVAGAADILSSADALKRLTQLQHDIPPFVADMEKVAKAFGQSAGAGALAENTAKLNQEIRKNTEGLVGNDKQLAEHLTRQKNSAELDVERAKKLREVTDAGDEQARQSAFAVTQAFAFGDAIEKNSIAFDHNTAIIAANQLELAGFTDAAERARKTADDVQRNALSALDISKQKAPWKDLLGGIDQGIASLAADIATKPADAFKNLTDTIRQLWGQLIYDLAKMEIEKSLIPSLAGLLGLDAKGNGSDVSAGVQPALSGFANKFRFAGGAESGQTAADGSGLAAGSGTQTGVSGASALIPFAAASVAVFGVANALNSLTGAASTSADALNQRIIGFITLQKSLENFRISAIGSSVEQALAQSKSQADAIRSQIETTLAGKHNQPEREKELGEVASIESQKNAKIASDFWAGIAQGLNSLKGPSGDYENALAAIEKQYADNKAGAIALLGPNADLSLIEALRVGQEQKLAAAYQETLKQTQLSLDAREAYAKGLTAEGDAIARRAREEKELFDATSAGYTDTQIAQLKYIQGLEDTAAATARAVQEHTDSLAAEAAAAQRAADALAAFTSATEALAAALAAGPQGTLSDQQAAGLQPLLDKQTADLGAYAQAAATYASDVANSADPFKTASDYYALLTAGIVLSGDAAAIAAKAFQDAAAKIDAGTSQIEQDVANGFTSGSQGIAQEAQNFGFTGLTPEEVKAQYKTFDPNHPLTNAEIENNKNIITYLGDLNKWLPAIADSTAQTAANGQPRSAEKEAVRYAAQSLTETTGNRMADYLSSIYIVEKEIRDAVKGSVSAHRGFDFSSVSPSLDLSAFNFNPNTAQQNSQPSRTTTITIAPVIQLTVTKSEDLLDAAGHIKAEVIDALTEQLAPAIDQQLRDLVADAQIRSGSNLVVDV